MARPCVQYHARRLHKRLASAADRRPWIRVALQVGRRNIEVGGTLMAWALAFRLFIWLLPCSLLLAAVLGLTVAGRRPAADLDQGTGANPLTSNVISQIGAQAEYGWYVTALLGLGFLGVAGYSVSRVLDGIHAQVRGAAVVRGFGPTLARAARYNAALLGIVVGNLAAPVVGAVVGQPVLLTVVSSLALYAGFGAVLLTVEWPPCWRRVLPGAALVAVGVEGPHLVAVLYVPGRIASASQLYGTLGVAATLLFWLTFIARLVVLGQVLNAVLAERDGAR